ncbi:expressed unknown protein [Seminavis robusta]|uniref:Methyltransferase domain-containing protein n=1 Tax=Seminavis robusta TaxID=568900 RepID=A0A9N8EIB0_9STRA|nr:expressed unknown protein [Seminavis robusta]|eukprot:Sro1180_g249690.1 n/a (395) ;mRNA; r:4692-5876
MKKPLPRVVRVLSTPKPLLFLLALTSSVANALTANPPIITCASSSELSRAVSFFCQSGDKVLQIGAQYDAVSRDICQAILPNGQATLVDVVEPDATVAKSGRCTHRLSSETFAARQEQQQQQDVNIVELERLEDWKQVVFRNNPIFDIIILDLGHLFGNDLHLATLSMTMDLLSLVAQLETTKSQPVILVKSKSLASLARRLVPAQHVMDGHWSLQGADKNGKLQRSHEPYVFCAVGVEEYRRLIPMTVTGGDVVIEVGCHFGRSTSLLNNQAATKDGTGYCIGVDIGPKIIQHAKAQYPSIQFAVADGRRTLELLKLRKDGELGYDVVYADIGGLSGAHGTLEALTMIESMGYALEPRCIVIKSLCMKRLASRLKSFSDIWAKKKKQQKDPGL